MKVINEVKTPEATTSSIDFDSLCQGFDNGSFYGLEYILDDDVFQNTTAKSSAPVSPSVDWFGLYN